MKLREGFSAETRVGAAARRQAAAVTANDECIFMIARTRRAFCARTGADVKLRHRKIPNVQE
jgi:hypothetical protein